MEVVSAFGCVIQSMIRLAWRAMVFEPVKKLYLLGPSFAGLGFWKGSQMSDICADLTSVPSTHWAKHPEECEEMIDRNVTSIVVLFQTVCYFLLLYSLVWYLWYRLFLLPPFLKGLRDQFLSHSRPDTPYDK